jgi:hypothetical protein
MKPELIRLRASSEQHFGNALLRNDSTKRATPDFPATEPDDRVNGMAVRAVHIAEVNPEKSEPLGCEKTQAPSLCNKKCLCPLKINGLEALFVV